MGRVIQQSRLAPRGGNTDSRGSIAPVRASNGSIHARYALLQFNCSIFSYS